VKSVLDTGGFARGHASPHKSRTTATASEALPVLHALQPLLQMAAEFRNNLLFAAVDRFEVEPAMRDVTYLRVHWYVRIKPFLAKDDGMQT
jgi:hypothetical protein